MVPIERGTVPLKCNRCRTVGTATFREAPPPQRPVDARRELMRIDGRFRRGIGRDPNIYCCGCGRPVRR